MIGIVVSRADDASTHVGEHLLDLTEWTEREDPSRPDGEGGGIVRRTDGFELRTFDGLHLHLEGVADAFDDPALLVFASRHAGETGPLLTTHFTGNFGPAEYGGTDGELATASPAAQAHLLGAFDRGAPPGYEVGIECTHHGPSAVGAPSLFAELGSGPAQWNDPDAARAVARAVLELHGVDTPGSEAAQRGGEERRGVDASGERTLVGFGGGHYAPRFERIIRETPWRVGHVAADWCLDAMGHPDDSRDVVQQAFERSGSRLAVVEGERPELEAIVRDLGYRVVSETWLRETASVPRWLTDAVEELLGPVDEGVRFGERTAAVAQSAPTEETTLVETLSVTSLPDELLDEAHGIDAARTRDLVARRCVAFETREGGTRVRGRAVVFDRADRAALVDALCDLLREKYESVTRDERAVIARRTAFDPALARELGVPEGPAFGKLAEGEPVEVDERRVEPEQVRIERERRFPTGSG